MGSIGRALKHFDKFYPYVYSSALWHSIRLGLLCKSKKMFLINSAYTNTDILIKQLKMNGAVNFIDNLDVKENGYQAFTKENKFDDGNKMVIGTNLNEFVTSTKYVGENEFFTKEISGSYVNYTSIHEDEEKIKYLTRDIKSIKSNFLEYEVLNLPSQLKVFAYPRCIVKKDFPVPYDELQQSGFYPIDGFSILVVLLMNIKKGDKILDMCAAPGGKSLAILHTGLPDELVCMDKDRSRVSRLKTVLKTHTFPDDFQKVSVIQGDSIYETRYMNNYFDKVLVDAPCSSDRHAVTTANFSMFLPQNEQKRISLSETQHSLLRTAISSCKVGGDIIYSTCTLSPMQNDKVVASLIKETNSQESKYQLKVVNSRSIYRRKHQKDERREPVPTDWFFTFQSEDMLGQVILPNILNNYGPGYMCKIRKVARD